MNKRAQVNLNTWNIEGSDTTQMNSKRPYNHILKNLFHEQATEIIPLLLPGYRVEQVLDVEMPDLKSTEMEGPPGELEQGLVGLALPEARVVNVYKTEWIEHSGNFERAYRVQHPETDKPTYLVIEFQTEREDEDLPRRLLRNYATVNRYALKDVEREDKHEGTIILCLSSSTLPISAGCTCSYTRHVSRGIHAHVQFQETRPLGKRCARVSEYA